MRIGATLGTAWSAVKLFLWQNRMIFRPGPLLPRTPADLGLAYEEVRLRTVGMTAHAWWVAQPCDESAHEAQSGDDRAVIFFHGSDGNITHELPTLHFLHSLGVHVLAVEYPGYGRSTGWTNEFDCYRAAKAAWGHVRRVRGLAPEQIVLFGQSVGSAMGAYLAARCRCRGLVFQSGFTSVPDLAAWLYPALPVRLFCFTRMNSLRRIARCQCPLLVLHSATDEHIPIAQARQIYAQAPRPKKFVTLQGAHHSRTWLHDPDVRAAWLELLSGRAACWP